MGLITSFSGSPSNFNVLGSNPYKDPDFTNFASLNLFTQQKPLPSVNPQDPGYFKNIYNKLSSGNQQTNSSQLPGYNDIVNNSALKKQLSTPIWDQQNTTQPTTQQIDYLNPNSTKNLFNEQQKKTNQLGFQVGLQTQNSSNPTIAANGNTMVGQAVSGQDVTGTQTTPQTDQQTNVNKPDYLSAGINAVGQVGSQIAQKVGGKAGQTISNVTKGVSGIASGIKTAVDASKAIKNGASAMKGAKGGGIAAAVGAAADMIGSFLPEKSEYSGDKGDVTQTMDTVYDGISDAAMAFGPIGMMVGGIMKGGKLLGKGMNAIGGGTDGMTTTDAILGSSFLNLTPIGLINGFGGSTTTTITKDNDAFEQVGSSYLGTNAKVDDAVHKSGKKYGLFSKKQFRKANELILKARAQQDTISDIANDARTRQQLLASMSNINSNRYAMQMQGGYDPTAIRAARHGMSIQLLNRARIILKAQKGLKLNPMQMYKKQAPRDWESIPTTGKPTYQDWVKDVNPNFQNENYDLEAAYNNLPYNQMQRWKYAVNSKNPSLYLDFHQGGDYPFHTSSVAPLQGTEDYIFLKKGTLKDNPELKGELDYYNNSGDFKNNYDLSYEGDRYYYRKKKPTSNQGTPVHKNGGSIINLVNPLDVPEFQNGGSINVIPDGALHARKHNMDLDGITKKGIPVVSEKDDGKIEQQAEIEKEEVILRLEVTQELEKLTKKYYSDNYNQKEKEQFALKAGQLLTFELLHNTKDNAGLL